MRRSECTRSWEAEALEDGRLTDDDRVSFERHARSCGECAAEQSALRRLHTAARRIPKVVTTDLNRRKQRLALLGRVARGTTRPFRGPGIALAAAIVVCLIGWRLWRSTPATVKPPLAAQTAPAPAPFEIEDVRRGEWSTETEGATTRVILRAGTAAFHVRPLAQAARFLVGLPDGEIEVRGTRFVVTIEDGKTTRVDVSEGVVDLRLRGVAPVTLRAGDSWAAPSSPAAPASVAVSVVTTALPPPLAASSTTTSAANSSVFAPPPDAAPTTQSDPFASAMDAFKRGDYADADARFAAFQVASPDDSRAEDAAFLRVVAHNRMGDGDGAARLAKEYLARFPAGLRRAEAQRLVGDSP